MAKQIRVTELAHRDFHNYADGQDPSRLIRRLIKDAKNLKTAIDEKIALVILEDSWWDLDKNPRQASSGPFLDGLSRYMDRLTVYHFNFYDTLSFEKALSLALKVSEKRVILYIGAHGSSNKVGGASLKSLLEKLSEKSKNDKKIEGVILSSCMAGGNGDVIPKAFGGKTHWLFGYSASVDWLGSILIETALLETICLSADDYCNSIEGMLDVFQAALNRFNPNWVVGEDRHGQAVPLKSALAFWARPKNCQTPQSTTKDLVSAAWKP